LKKQKPAEKKEKSGEGKRVQKTLKPKQLTEDQLIGEDIEKKAGKKTRRSGKVGQ